MTFKANIDFIHSSFEVVQASITLQHNSLKFFRLYRSPPNRRNNLTDSMFTEQLPDILEYVDNLPGLVCLVSDMNIHNYKPLQSTTTTTTNRCGHINDWSLFELTMTSIKKLLFQTYLNQTIIALKILQCFGL